MGLFQMAEQMENAWHAGTQLDTDLIPYFPKIPMPGNVSKELTGKRFRWGKIETNLLLAFPIGFISKSILRMGMVFSTAGVARKLREKR